MPSKDDIDAIHARWRTTDIDARGVVQLYLSVSPGPRQLKRTGISEGEVVLFYSAGRRRGKYASSPRLLVGAVTRVTKVTCTVREIDAGGEFTEFIWKLKPTTIVISTFLSRQEVISDNEAFHARLREIRDLWQFTSMAFRLGTASAFTRNEVAFCADAPHQRGNHPKAPQPQPEPERLGGKRRGRFSTSWKAQK